MRILLDLDGCVVDFLPTWLAEYRAISGDVINVTDIRTYGFDQFVAKPELLWKALTTGDVFRKSSPIPNCLGAVKHLHEQHELRFVTYVHESVKDGHRAKLDWLAHYLPFIQERQVIFARDKFVIDGDIMIEDASHNLLDWLDEATFDGERFGYLMNQPYNKTGEINNHPFCKRVDSLWDVIEDMRRPA